MRTAAHCWEQSAQPLTLTDKVPAPDSADVKPSSAAVALWPQVAGPNGKRKRRRRRKAICITSGGRLVALSAGAAVSQAAACWPDWESRMARFHMKLPTVWPVTGPGFPCRAGRRHVVSEGSPSWTIAPTPVPQQIGCAVRQTWLGAQRLRMPARPRSPGQRKPR